MVKWVKQIDENGCVIAALSMVTDLSYEEVKVQFARSFCVNCGLSDEDIAQFLANNGYATSWRYLWNAPSRMEREIWPPEPQTELNLCKVKVYPDSRMNHIVVVTKNGTVYDPEREEHRKLSDYHRVYCMIGVVKIP
jgi:hypothetical protein